MQSGRVAAVLAVPGTIALDFGILVYLLNAHPGYEVLVCGDRGSADAAALVDIRPTHSLAEADRADVVLVPSYEDPRLPLPEEYLEVLRRADQRGARIVAACTAAFALAAAGVLDGRTATTHWRYTDRLRLEHPRVDVVENRLFVEDGPVLTSAGAGGLIDACLHVIRSDFGATAADEVAKEVVSLPRGAAEPQYVDLPTPPRTSLRATREWVVDNLASPITVQRMADRSLLPRRTFIRHFERETGMSPMHWVVSQRVLSARRLLESSDWSVERIAGATGFGTAANFRATFRRAVGTTPTAYRKSHARLPEPSARTPRTERSRTAGRAFGKAG
ncbi:transcriptional regulator GlxA family with amidase domain [Saccharothrix coeruleofusca]|uniref:GlxA family transcriptional regulator n=1 Tax=Saccharothrix coeruleofusca TaxID=33919 RepID=UPI001AE70A98|nr:helix-turn-helix domain-containing protein [Saccharothrix coeruleofusca]MBP2339763.1 transcriptional regulator GlxA family with amidase domain [Saccharothrix coeruleofusca]